MADYFYGLIEGNPKMSVPQLPLNKRFAQQYSLPGEIFIIDNLMYQELDTASYNIPSAGTITDPSTYTEAVTTTGKPEFQFSLDTTKANHYVYISTQQFNTGTTTGRTLGLGIRWFDEDSNVLHNDGNNWYFPQRDTLYCEVSALAPSGAVRGSITWIAPTGGYVWNGSALRYNNFQRYIISWN